MIIVEENTTATIKMYIRDFSEPIYYLEVISEGNRKQESFTDITSGSTYDDFRKVLRFAYDVSTLNKESFYILKIWETEGKTKLLSQDKMYIIPTGSDVSTYQPKLTTTEKTMNNEFKIYGEQYQICAAIKLYKPCDF